LLELPNPCFDPLSLFFGHFSPLLAAVPLLLYCTGFLSFWLWLPRIPTDHPGATRQRDDYRRTPRRTTRTGAVTTVVALRTAHLPFGHGPAAIA
jgi:hypothetical protein